MILTITITLPEDPAKPMNVVAECTEKNIRSEDLIKLRGAASTAFDKLVVESHN